MYATLVPGTLLCLFNILSAKEEGYRVLQSAPYSSECYHICTCHDSTSVAFNIVGMWGKPERAPHQQFRCYTFFCGYFIQKVVCLYI